MCGLLHCTGPPVLYNVQVMIRQSHPLDYKAFDRTMQDIVYKVKLYCVLYSTVQHCTILYVLELVPELEQAVYKREREF